MPIEHELRDGVIWTTTVGDVDYEDGIGSMRRALEAARAADSSRRWDIVFDVRRSSEDRSSDELQAIADFVAASDAVLSGRCVVIAGDDFHFGLSRMFQAYCELKGLTPQVVREVDAAESWLRGESG